MPPTRLSLCSASIHACPFSCAPQGVALAYQLYLVRSANLQHMRRFSVFLALPSAAVRAMATRQLVVSMPAVTLVGLRVAPARRHNPTL
jgi:hypothetical protein